jgi:hypothetical protein
MRNSTRSRYGPGLGGRAQPCAPVGGATIRRLYAAGGMEIAPPLINIIEGSAYSKDNYNAACVYKTPLVGGRKKDKPRDFDKFCNAVL